MFGAWTGPHRSVSNLSRWATRLRIRRVPDWLNARAADRWAFRGGLVTLVLLLAVAWLVPSQQAPADVPNADAGNNRDVAPRRRRTTLPSRQRPARHIDAELKNAILVHVPEDQAGQDRGPERRCRKPINLPGRSTRSSEPKDIRSCRPLFFSMAAGGKTPSGTTIYPDERDPNVLVIRIGLNDRT